MKTAAAVLALLVLLAGCEGEQGPTGPAGPQGEPGLDGSGVVSVHAWQNETALTSNTYEVDIPGWSGLQTGESVSLEAFASVEVNGTVGWSELPMMIVTNGGQQAQASAVVNYEAGTVTFTYLQGWYVYFIATVVHADNAYW